MALFRAKFACILAIRNPVFRWESCKDSVWESVKNCSSVCEEAGTHDWISRVARGWKPPDWSTRAKHAKSVTPVVHYRTKFPGWPSRLLAAWTCDSTQSRGQATRTPCLAKYDFSHSFSPYYIYIPLYPRFRESFQREFWERNPREKQDWLIHNLYLRDSSNSSTLFLSIVKSLRGSLPKPFLTISISVRRLFGALGSS